MPPSENQLRALHDKMAVASAKLAGVTERQMFGCDAFFADGVIFGLIWKKGRIGLKLPDVSLYDQLLELGDA